MKTTFAIFSLVFLLQGCNDYHTLKDQIPDISRTTPLKTEIIASLSDIGIYETWGLVKLENHFVFHETSGIKTITLDELYSHQQQPSSVTRSISENITQHTALTATTEYSISAFDFNTGQLVEYSPKSRNKQMDSRITQLPENKQHLVAIKGKHFTISTGIYEEGRYLYCSLERQEGNYYLSYPNTSDYPDISEKTKAMLYASNVLRLRPDENAFVCADMYSGSIEFCRIINNKIEQIKEVCFHAPRVKISGKTYPKIEYQWNNSFGFTDIAVSINRVYAIYSGKTYWEDNLNFTACQKILEFDWDGYLLKTYTIDTPITSISYDPTENVIYAIGSSQDVPLIKINL